MHDVVRRRYLAKLFDLTGRNVIIYDSGWLQKRGVARSEINDEDKDLPPWACASQWTTSPTSPCGGRRCGPPLIALTSR